MSNEILWVEIIEAKPNKMFTEAMRQSVRFLRFNRRVPCAECGKRKSKILWTMLCEFKAKIFPTGPAFSLQDSGKVHQPLTAVCGDHPLTPAWPEKDKAGESKKKGTKKTDAAPRKN